VTGKTIIRLIRRSQVFTSKCGPAISWSPWSSYSVGSIIIGVLVFVEIDVMYRLEMEKGKVRQLIDWYQTVAFREHTLITSTVYRPRAVWKLMKKNHELFIRTLPLGNFSLGFPVA